MTFWDWADRNAFEIVVIVALITTAAISVSKSCSGSETDRHDIRLEIGPEPRR